jgi:hypothetical protein
MLTLRYHCCVVQAIELPEFENVFSLKAIRDVDGLEAVRGGDYAQLGPEDDEDEGVVLGGSDMEEEVSQTRLSRGAE